MDHDPNAGFSADSPHENEGDSPHQYLFDQLGAIESAADADSLEQEVIEAQRGALQAQREAVMVKSISELMNAEDASVFTALYGVEKDGVRSRRAMDVLDDLIEYGVRNEDDDAAEKQLDTLMSMTGVVLDASITERTDTGELRYGMTKVEVQYNILIDDTFSAEMKRALISVIDRVMPGEALDTNDPDAVSQLLERDGRQFDELRDGSRKRTAALIEFSRFDHLRDDPEYRSLLADVNKSVRESDTSAAAAAKFVGDDRLELLGISHAEFSAAIDDTYARIERDEDDSQDF